MRLVFLLMAIPVLLGINHAAYAYQAKELYQLCKPLSLRGFEKQRTADLNDDLVSANNDLACVGTVRVILDFSAQLCFQAFNDKLTRAELKNLWYYMTSSNVAVNDAILNFVSRYDAAMSDAPAHMAVIQSVNQESVLNNCVVGN